MEIKTSELTGPALDWAVAECALDREDFGWRPGHKEIRAWSEALSEYVNFSPSTDWSLAGPIIEREGISVHKFDNDVEWEAHLQGVAFLSQGVAPLED